MTTSKSMVISVGAPVGTAVGVSVGECVSPTMVGAPVGASVGAVGLLVGEAVGIHAMVAVLSATHALPSLYFQALPPDTSYGTIAVLTR